MFKNAGGKLQSLAILNFWLFIIAGLIVGAVIGKNGVGIVICLPISLLLGWGSSIVLYAFGELCENVQKIAQRTTHHANSRPTDQSDRFDTQEEFDDFCDALKKI